MSIWRWATVPPPSRSMPCCCWSPSTESVRRGGPIVRSLSGNNRFAGRPAAMSRSIRRCRAPQQLTGIASHYRRAVLITEAGVTGDTANRVLQADLLAEGKVGAQQQLGRRHKGEQSVEYVRGRRQGGVEIELGDLTASNRLGGFQLGEHILRRWWLPVFAKVCRVRGDHGLAIDQLVRH